MINQPQFETFDDLEKSVWLNEIVDKFSNDQWPDECIRCQQSEQSGEKSIRQYFIDYHENQNIHDYLVVGGVLDNICNSACQTCDATLSTKIGQLENKKSFLITTNKKSFYSIPQDRIVKLDINGGEPSASKNYKELLLNLPPNVKEIRINTNCSRLIPNLDSLLRKRIRITITVSLDGIEKIHNYLRWPISWHLFKKNLFAYLCIPGVQVNTWTTVSALNINNFFDIKQFCEENNINNSFSLLHTPDPLNIKYKNRLTLQAKENFSNHPLYDQIAVDKNNDDELFEFIQKQDNLRNININEYLNI